MTLELKFHPPEFKSTSIDESHLQITDRCGEVDLEGNEAKLTEAQKMALNVNRTGEELPSLYWRSLYLTEHYAFRKGLLEVNCPSCGNNYKVTREEYEEAKEAFIEKLIKNHLIV